MDDVSVFTAGAFFGVIASTILILIIALRKEDKDGQVDGRAEGDAVLEDDE